MFPSHRKIDGDTLAHLFQGFHYTSQYKILTLFTITGLLQGDGYCPMDMSAHAGSYKLKVMA